MAKIGEKLKNELKGILNKNIGNITNSTSSIKITGILGGTSSTISTNNSTSISSALSSQENMIKYLTQNEYGTTTSKIDGKKFLCKYQVKNLVMMKDDEKIEMDHSNILSIEYMNDYEYNIMSLLKVTLRIDIRKKIWILKNKKDILVKFELNKIGLDTEAENTVTSSEEVWNGEYGLYFNDEDESADIGNMESRINLNEGKDFQSNNIEDENYFESQNTLDIYLVSPELLKASRYSFNKVYTESTLQNIVGHMLTESGHVNVLMSKFENDEIYKELLLPANPVYKNLIYLDQYYGLYKTGAIIYYDIDALYVLNSNGKLTVARDEEWTETTVLVRKISDSVPGNGMIRREGEKIFYPVISDSDINPQNFSIAKNAELGSAAKIVVTDTTDVELHEADQSFINTRNENVAYIKDNNRFTGDVVKARMEENECVLYISGDNLDIKAFTPNKIFKVVFDEPSKHKLYGNNTYRLSYSYHFLKLESEGYMASSHRVIFKKTASGTDSSSSRSSSSNSSSMNVSSILGSSISNITGEIGKFESRLSNEINKVTSNVTNTINREISNVTNKMSSSIGSKVDNYKKNILGKIKI